MIIWRYELYIQTYAALFRNMKRFYFFQICAFLFGNIKICYFLFIFIHFYLKMWKYSTFYTHLRSSIWTYVNVILLCAFSFLLRKWKYATLYKHFVHIFYFEICKYATSYTQMYVFMEICSFSTHLGSRE